MKVDVDTHNFESEVIKSELPVLVDFWAPWCGPCKILSPLIDEIAQENNGKIKVAKLNVDNSPDIASQYTIMSIPTLLIFKNGEVMEKKVGAISKNELNKFIQPYIQN